MNSAAETAFCEDDWELPLTELAEKVEKIYGERSSGPFPYADFRKVELEYGESFQKFISDFDMDYFDVLGCASSTKRFLIMPAEEAKTYQIYVRLPFFEEYPQYQAAEAFITPENTPDLYIHLREMERMRTGMRLLLQQRLAGEE